MMSARYLWWRSCYDGILHAFPVAPGSRIAHQHYRATCTHAAPPDLTDHDNSAPRCALCVLIIGDRSKQSTKDTAPTASGGA